MDLQKFIFPWLTNQRSFSRLITCKLFFPSLFGKHHNFEIGVQNYFSKDLESCSRMLPLHFPESVFQQAPRVSVWRPRIFCTARQSIKGNGGSEPPRFGPLHCCFTTSAVPVPPATLQESPVSSVI